MLVFIEDVWLPMKYLFRAPFGSQALISNGANIEAKMLNGWTPLMLASMQGHLTTLEVYTVYMFLDRSLYLH